ncbi:MAG: hypothetical protein KDJ69_12845 [Nitratireductor sp.]|nr:hypothetical protein [Nitratireductor sp.]
MQILESPLRLPGFKHLHMAGLLQVQNAWPELEGRLAVGSLSAMSRDGHGLAFFSIASADAGDSVR